MIKYLLFPDYVISQTDGDEHYIGAAKLAQLYGVQFSECVVWYPHTQLADDKNLIHLFPRRDGDYRLPNAKP